MIKIAFSPIYYHELPKGHRFPMLKYELIPEQNFIRVPLIGTIYLSQISVTKRYERNQ